MPKARPTMTAAKIKLPAHVRKLQRRGACEDAIMFARKYEDPQRGWDECERGDWMLWLCGRLSGKPGSDARKKLVLCACECARLSLKHVRAGEDRPRVAIETAERWARGDESVSLADVRKAAASAYAASAAYAAYAAAYAAYAAAYAAYGGAAYAYAARTKTLSQCAAIVRRHYPVCPLIESEADDE
jgi:hypothetical protein